MKVKVKVPATSANLGPGFDVAGLALTLYNTFTFELADQGLNITGCPEQFCNEENMTYQAFKQAAEICGLEYQGVNIECSGDVPYTRGLGSSSTCIVAGIVGAFAFKDKVEDRQEILELATAIEGHPDNVAPAIFGGLTVSVMEEDNVLTLNIPVKHDYRFGDLIKGFNEIMGVLEQDEKVLGAYLSGAGPTIMAVIRGEDKMGVVRIKEELGALIKDWQVVKLELDNRGYTADYE